MVGMVGRLEDTPGGPHLLASSLCSEGLTLLKERSDLCPQLLGGHLQALGMSCLIMESCLPRGLGYHARRSMLTMGFMGRR